MLLLSQPNELDHNTFIIHGNTTYSYNDIFKLGDSLFDNNEKEIVLILCDKDIETIVSYVAAIRHNKVPLLVDKNYKPELLRSFITNYKPNYIITGENIDLELLEYTRNSSDIVMFQRNVPLSSDIFDKLALLIPTSGSTGDPKCVRISANNIDTCTESICDYLNFDENRVSISLLPIHYSYGLSVLHNTIYSRAKYVISTHTILEKEIWNDIENYGVTDFSGVPFTMKILRRLTIDYHKVRSLKYVTQAGGYLPESFSNYFYEEFGNHDIKYFTMYGQTEASPRISYLSPDDSVAKHGSAGRAISCGKLTIGTNRETVGIGELVYEGPNVSLGYAENIADLSKGDEFNGVLFTGDIVELDEDGFIKIVGRKKRFIKINGTSVNLDKIEKDLGDGFPGVAVVGKDDKLVLILSEVMDTDLRKIVTQKYGFNKTNVKVFNVDCIPFNSSGKTDYKLLNEQYCG
ncbi:MULTISPECIES: AMP-binding protein [unclassified Colwellia]|jgi:long-chain acyl-CoA synthetase|uniref:AMP-binding protein n=1 Tax=unclassified Colwellia TaxID=196834 RepID=UPI0015F3FDC1|nr:MULTISPECIES: AMP-binding protein [unclassified Colwellia]MBA6257113.1 AMP-binding protein [Colwellia sp. MB3u-28]MBA6258655.1 AMP-binding protein [Colwellia sp. MB3u-41]